MAQDKNNPRKFSGKVGIDLGDGKPPVYTERNPKPYMLLEKKPMNAREVANSPTRPPMSKKWIEKK